MLAMRAIGNLTLWVLAILGVVSGALWGASRAGIAQPVIVISGSMNPGIEAGDLLVALPVDIADLQPGQVATLTSEKTGKFVTHRVVAVERQGDAYAVNMKGDANAVVDAETYFVPAGTRVWQPRVVVPEVGSLIVMISRPEVAFPALLSLVALAGAAAIPPVRGRHEAPRRGLLRRS